MINSTYIDFLEQIETYGLEIRQNLIIDLLNLQFITNVRLQKLINYHNEMYEIIKEKQTTKITEENLAPLCTSLYDLYVQIAMYQEQLFSELYQDKIEELLESPFLKELSEETNEYLEKIGISLGKESQKIYNENFKYQESLIEKQLKKLKK